MRKFNKIVASFIVCIMIFTNFINLKQVYALENTIKVKVRIEGNNSTLVPEKEISLNTFDLNPYGVSKDIKDIKVIHALIKALESESINAKDPKNLQINGGSYLSNIAGIKERSISDKDGWMYYINNNYVPYMIDEGNLKNGDSLVFFFQEDYTKNIYSYFNQSYIQAKVGETINLNLAGLEYDFVNNKKNNININNANILINNQKLIKSGKYITTDEEGNVKLSFNKEGIYNISAERVDEESGRKNISRPYCKILIKDGEIKVNKEPLNSIIKESENLLLKEVGNKKGQYSKEAKEILQKYLQEAKIIFNKESTTLEQVNIEIAKLQNAILKFKNSINKDENLNKVILDLVNYYNGLVPNNYKSFDFITTMALRRAGMKTDILSKKMNIYGMNSISNDSRNVMNLIGAGKNPKNYKDEDYTKNLPSYNYEDEKDSTIVAKSIIAMDMAQVSYNKEKVLGSLLRKAHKEDDGKISFGIVTEGSYDEFLDETTEDEYNSYPENTAWTLIALSRHKDVKGVQETIDGIKKYLKSKQNNNGLIDNSADTALVIQGIISLGENPLDDFWMIKNGDNKVSLLDGILSCKLERGFSQKPKTSITSDVATPQVLAALVDINTMTSMYVDLCYREESLPVKIEISGEGKVFNGGVTKLSTTVLDFNNLVIKNPAIIWESSDNSIATVEDGVINGLKEGTVEITAYIIGNKNIKETKKINVIPAPKIDYSKRLKKEIEFLKNHYTSYTSYEFLAVPSAVLSGIPKEEVQKHIYRYSKNNTVLQNAKIIIALLSVELDPRADKVKDKVNNYVETLEKCQVKDGKNKGKFIINERLDGNSIEAQSYALIALDLANGNFNRKDSVKAILSMLNNPNYTKESSYKNIKTEAIALTALSKYQDIDGAKFKIQNLLKFIKDNQNSDGAFDSKAGSSFINSPMATGAVVQALLANNIDPLSWQWTKKGNTMLDGLLKSKFVGRTIATSGYSQGQGLNFENSESSYYAFAALVQMLNKKSIFDTIKEEKEKVEEEAKEKAAKEEKEKKEKEAKEKAAKEEKEKKEKEIKETVAKEEKKAKVFNETISSILNNTLNQKLNNSWYVLSLNKLGKKIPSILVNNIENKIKNSKGVFNQTTEYEKMVFAALSIGENPKNAYGYDLISPIYNDDMEQGINAYVFGLLALDSFDFNLPKNCRWNREKLIKAILDNRTKDNGWTFFGDKADSDMTGMVLSALAPYYKTKPEVKEAVDRALDMLSKVQTKNGGYTSWGNENSNSISMVIIGLSSLEIDIMKDSRFIKNGNTLLDALYKFKTKDGKGFGFIDNQYNEVSTEQGLRALVSYKNLKENKGSIYKFKYIPKPENEDKLISKPIEIKNKTGIKEFKLATDAKIRVEATNNSKETKRATLIVGLYDKNNKMINYVAVKQNLKSGDNVEMEAMIAIPKEGDYKVKAFVWDTLEDMNALSKVMNIPVK